MHYLVMDEVIDKAQKVSPSCPEISENAFGFYDLNDDIYYTVYESVKHFTDNIDYYSNLQKKISRSSRMDLNFDPHLESTLSTKKEDFKYLKENTEEMGFNALQKLIKVFNQDSNMINNEFNNLIGFFNGLRGTMDWLDYCFEYSFRTHFYKPYLHYAQKLKEKSRCNLIILNTSLERHIYDNKNVLLNKSNTDTTNWWLYSYPKNLLLHQKTKLIVQVISKTGKYAYDDSGIYFTGGGNGPYYGIVYKESENLHSIHYLQGILSSKLSDFYLHQISSPFRGGYWSYGKRFIEKIPIRTINFDKIRDVALHNRMVTLVKQMLQLHKELADIKTPDSERRLQRQIETIDKQINVLVYKLYDLTDEEIKIVEEVLK